MIYLSDIRIALRILIVLECSSGIRIWNKIELHIQLHSKDIVFNKDKNFCNVKINLKTMQKKNQIKNCKIVLTYI